MGELLTTAAAYLYVGILVVCVMALAYFFYWHRGYQKRMIEKYGHCPVCGGTFHEDAKPYQADRKTGKALKRKILVQCQECYYIDRSRIEEIEGE